MIFIAIAAFIAVVPWIAITGVRGTVVAAFVLLSLALWVRVFLSGIRTPRGARDLRSMVSPPMRKPEMITEVDEPAFMKGRATGFRSHERLQRARPLSADGGKSSTQQGKVLPRGRREVEPRNERPSWALRRRNRSLWQIAG